MRLSILICTVLERQELFRSLYSELQRQMSNGSFFLSGDVEILVNTDNKEISIGAKRQALLQEAKGDFICFVDDDDIVSSDYISSIYNAIVNNPKIDCIGIRGTMTTNKANLQNWSVRNIYDWADNVDGYRYVRFTHHWCPVRRMHALKAGFPDKRFGEDYDYSMRLKKLDILNSEFFIDKDIYHYNYNAPKSKKESNDKYGIK